MVSLFDIQENDQYMVCTDEQRMVQVVLNLLSNALKFTKDDGKILIVCKILIIKGDSYLQVSV